jgi:predicted RNase H-like HicB family nuclease
MQLNPPQDFIIGNHMTKRLTAVIHREGDGFVALCPELDVASQGDTIESARDNLREALELFFECASPSEVQERVGESATMLDLLEEALILKRFAHFLPQYRHVPDAGLNWDTNIFSHAPVRANMSVALYISLEKEIDGFDASSVCGKALSRAQDQLDRIATKLGLTPLEKFISVGEEEFDMALGDEIPEDIEVPEYKWFSAKDGLKTVQGLLKYLGENPSALAEAERVMDDLESAERVLQAAVKKKVRFHFGIDF